MLPHELTRIGGGTFILNYHDLIGDDTHFENKNMLGILNNYYHLQSIYK